MIDFTKMRAGTKVGHLTVRRCPKCRKNGRRTCYPDGTQLFVHTGEPSHGMFLVRERCFVGRPFSLKGEE